MGMGLGLGAFANGLVGGLVLGEAMQKSEEERDLKNQIAAAAEENKQRFGDKAGSDEAKAALNSQFSTIYARSGRLDDARKAEALSDSAKARHEDEKLKAGMKAVSEEARQKFGDGNGGLTDEGYAFMMKKGAAHFSEAGQHDKARQLLKWADESETKANTKHFANGLLQIDAGDIDGFDKTIAKLGAAKGYGPEVGIGFERGKDGKIITKNGTDGEIYYRMRITPPGASEPLFQDVPKAKLKDVYARWFNPLAAFEADQASSADKSKREADNKDYATRKGIDAWFADPQRAPKERGEVIDGLRKRNFGGKEFDELGEAQKEAEIQKELQLRRGGPAGAVPGRLPAASAPPFAANPSDKSVIMDRAPGRPVPLPAQPTGMDNRQGLPVAANRAGMQPTYGSRGVASDEEIAALEQDVTNFDARIAETKTRSRNPDVLPALLGPLEISRANAASRLRQAQESRNAPDRRITPETSAITRKDAEIFDLGRKIGELRTRGAGYEKLIGQLEAQREALHEEANAARRGLMMPVTQGAPGLSVTGPM